MAQSTQPERMRFGLNVIVLLGALTVIEFVIAVTMSGNGQLALLAALAVVKAALIAQYFMHFPQLRRHIARVWNAVAYDFEE